MRRPTDPTQLQVTARIDESIVTHPTSHWKEMDRRERRMRMSDGHRTYPPNCLTWRSAVLRGNDTADKDETRLIVSYSIPLL